MTKEFKQTFFTSLLVVLLVVSNLIGLKLTNFLDLTISVDFLTYPFTFLCTLLILNLSGKKSAYQAILVSALIQIFITISYTLAISLGNQTVIPDSAVYVNELFKVKEVNILASLISFMSSHYVLIYIYDNFKKFGKELYGVVIGLLGALFLNATILSVITLYGNDFMFIINMLLSNVIISIIMLIIITLLFYLLKEKELKVVEINNININVNKFITEDKSIEDIIVNSEKKEVKKEKEVKKKKSSSKNTSKKVNSTTKNVKKTNNKAKPNNNKKQNTSQRIVNKKDK